MDINGGGYTFFSTSSLNYGTSLLESIYTDRTQILFRVLSRTNNQSQPYILTKQLSLYSAYNISIQYNNNVGYTTAYTTPQQSAAFGNYFFIGFIPKSLISTGTTQGCIANNVTVSFSNCNGDSNSYWALFSNMYAIGGGCCGGMASMSQWLNSALPQPNGYYMPLSFYYFAEILEGGCGGFGTSNTFTGYSGVAFGLI